MPLQIHSEVIEVFMSHTERLQNKTVLFVDGSFDFSDVEKSVDKNFINALDTVVQAKCVLASMIIPSVSVSGATCSITGPCPVSIHRNGKIEGFVILDGDVSPNIIEDTRMSSRILMASNSIGQIGSPEMMVLSGVETSKEITFYTFNFSLMGM